MTVVLVIDDEPLIAMALEAELADAGYEVVTAVNGRHGLERLTETPRPDLVLTDVMMPVMNGFDLIAAMAESPEWKAIPVIVLSSLPEASVRARVNGATFLRKPYTADEVLSAIARALRPAT